MTLISKVGTFTLNTASGPQSIVGVGFQPDYVIFLTGGATALDTFEPDSSMSIGDSRNRFSACFMDDGSATALQSTSWGECIKTYNPGSRVSFSSYDADGFTISVNTAPASGVKVSYFAMKGMAAFATGQKKWFRGDTATGEGGVLVTPYLGDIWWQFSTYGARFVDGRDESFWTSMAVGWATKALGDDKGVGSWAVGGSSTELTKYLANNRSMSVLDFYGRLTTMNTGWVMTHDGPVNSGLDGTYQWGMFDLSGPSQVAGAVTGAGKQPLAPGVQTIKTGFQPKAVWFATAAAATPNAQLANPAFCFGVSDGVSNAAMFGAAERRGSPWNANRYHSGNRCLLMGDHTDTIFASARCDITANGFKLTWPLADAVARDYVWMAFSNTDLVVPDPPVSMYFRAT